MAHSGDTCSNVMKTVVIPQEERKSKAKSKRQKEVGGIGDSRERKCLKKMRNAIAQLSA